MSHNPDPLSFFRLKPIRVARVSEISETSYESPAPPEQRINFHIGNPLQDARLSSAFVRIALGDETSFAGIHQEGLSDAEVGAIREHLGWDEADQSRLEFFVRAIQKSIPYLPRGGYLRKSPHALIEAFCAWLEHQPEPLRYDSGAVSGKREIILAAGGVHETLRMILFTISSYLEIVPARVLSYRCEILPLLKTIPNLLFENLADDEQQACEQIGRHLTSQPEIPTFLVIGSILGEATRRKLRLMSLDHPLFFIEANDAPNHLSLAREAKLIQRVIRLLSPAIFAPRLQALSPVFIAGNAEFLSVIENVHFNFKGTPSASEVEFLHYLLEQNLATLPQQPPNTIPGTSPAFEGVFSSRAGEITLPRLAGRVEQRLEDLLNGHSARLAVLLERLEGKAAHFDQLVQRAWKDGISGAQVGGVQDEFAALEVKELFDLLVEKFDQPEFCRSLQRSFLSAFIKHQPQYRPEACLATSGSSRTALGMLGFHCGIRSAVFPDLSWSYEQCFPDTYPVALTGSLELDVEAMIEKVEQLCQSDPAWSQHGAVVINNPHNATGQIFHADSIRRLVAYCLQHGVYVVDDLAYQNMAPVNELPEIQTARQVAVELVRRGVIQDEQAERVITVHSISKTDCLAGARLAVVEIRDERIRQRFEQWNAVIRPNLMAIFISYLFYRNSTQSVRSYWRLRNAIFSERAGSLLAAVENLPLERNPFQLAIIPPAGSMYPRLQIGKLPPGLSLDWLASSLARRGIGLLPLATFARTEKGYETGRATFRLTLGGVDNAAILLSKTRRLLIDLNRLIAEEDAQYNRKRLSFRPLPSDSSRITELTHAADVIAKRILSPSITDRSAHLIHAMPSLDYQQVQQEFLQRYAPERLAAFRTRLLNRGLISDELMRQSLEDGGKRLVERLEREFMKDSLPRRQEQFRLRSYDRTVHPTQMYSLQAEWAFEAILAALIARQPVSSEQIEKAAQELWREYLGLNVAISSQQESGEVLLDLAALTASEQYAELFTDVTLAPFLSFWSDWDGSNRPSGQGHRLVAAVVMENVRRLARILRLLLQNDPRLPVNPELLSSLSQLAQRNQRFTHLLDEITLLTHQLEQRYRGVLPFATEATPDETSFVKSLARRWHLRRDPIKRLWQHNDRYEQKMLELRQQRREALEDYLALNKQLRKQLHALIPAIQTQHLSNDLLREVVGYRDLLQRVVFTPRIQQSMITARDQFAIDTTVYNLHEINMLAGKYGNPGMMLAAQISLSTQPEALISLDRKMRTRLGQARRENPTVELPSVWLVPLFEEVDSVKNIRGYLDQTWDYATQSRQISQSPQSRFTEIISEVFIAGSDLSQQVSQATGAYLYRKAKYEIHSWLSEHGVAESVRVKIGSGEPMQRQGAYYSDVAGQPAFQDSADDQRRFSKHLQAAARRSTAYAVTPLQGVFLGGDLKTFQSNLCGQLRFLPARELVSLLYHVRESQKTQRNDLIRAAETIAESRLGAQGRGQQELERLTIGDETSLGNDKPLFEQFLEELTVNFRQILYGREEDVVGIHIISYFIGRSIPQLRDRPTSRKSLAAGAQHGQRILANIAEMIPLSRQGSLLRAISHNQAQTAVLGLSQLTTGLFRALARFAQKSFGQAEQDRMIAERLLPYLPVYEILNNLRLYQERQGTYLERLETAFPAGNSAFVALREDNDAMQRYLPLFQQELLRRHGVNVGDFFSEGVFIPDLLPTLRPDLAVLLQKNLFNTELEPLLAGVSGRIPGEYRAEAARLLHLPEQIHYWRSIIWEVIGESLYQRVHSFTELAVALYAFSATRAFVGRENDRLPGLNSAKLPPALAGFFRAARPDDEMRHFLLGAIDYLNSFTQNNLEAPVSIIRAMNDAERIAHIEESLLPIEGKAGFVKQNLIRCCVLQIARLAGENG